MIDIKKAVDGLIDKDNKTAYQCLIQLKKESCKSNEVYKFFDIFTSMLDNDNSYIRTRGIILIAVNSQWDIECKTDRIINEYLKHITDDKPITARQCIKVLPVITQYKPNLRHVVINALQIADTQKYEESMQSLVTKDIQKTLRDIEKQP